MKLYIKDGNIIDPRMGIDTGEGTTLYNGTEAQMAALGYEVYVPQPYVETREAALQRQIEELENSFTDDYKIIKCYEAQLMNKPMPYDIEELINARDAKRALINQLEEELKSLTDLEEENNI